MGNRTLSTIKKNLNYYLDKGAPLFYKTAYYFAMPTIFITGALFIKPRAPFVDGALEWLGLIQPKPQMPMGMFGPPPGMIMPGQ